jgi:hypothetical protein
MRGFEVLCKVLNWRRKSVTDELGRLSTRDRSIGGMSTAAQAAATTRRTSWAIDQVRRSSVSVWWV